MDFIDGGDESLLQVNSALLEGGLGGREDLTKTTIKMNPKAPGINQTIPIRGTCRGCVTKRENMCRFKTTWDCVANSDQ